MFQMSVIQPTLLSTLAPTSDSDESGSNWLRTAFIVLLGSLAITAAAKVKVPFYPVEMTMQTYVILVMSMVFGWRLALATVMLYLAQGAFGFPVFTGSPEKGVGLAYMMGPTGGYLAGFVLASVAVGWLAERGWDRSIFSTAAAMVIGIALIYIPGLLYLGSLFGWDKPILEWGLYPFLYADAVKILLAVAALPFAWRLVGEQ